MPHQIRRDAGAQLQTANKERKTEIMVGHFCTFFCKLYKDVRIYIEEPKYYRLQFDGEYVPSFFGCLYF